MMRRVITAREQYQLLSPWLHASVGGGIEPTMGVDRQVRKFDHAIQTARDAGDEDRARYTEFVKQLMLDELEAGRPRPFSFYSPMIDEEFS